MRPQPEEKLIGWKGETWHDVPRTTFSTLSWEPRIFHAEHLLSTAEVEHLIAKAKPRIERSGVLDTETGESKLSEIRTSSGMFFDRAEDQVIKAIEEKLANWLMVPAFNGEGLQILRYEPTQKYEPHFDYFFNDKGTDNGGNRLVTALIYLSNVEEGGETVFPNVPVPDGQRKEGGYSECAMQGLAVKPRAGDAVAFWSLQTDGRLDQGSMHAGCPVIRGEKWSATKWVHVARYSVGDVEPKKVRHIVHVPPPPPNPPGCADLDARCAEWAEAGECEANGPYTVGTAEHPGFCLVSCGRCDLGPNAPLDRGPGKFVEPPVEEDPNEAAGPNPFSADGKWPKFKV